MLVVLTSTLPFFIGAALLRPGLESAHDVGAGDVLPDILLAAAAAAAATLVRLTWRERAPISIFAAALAAVVGSRQVAPTPRDVVFAGPGAVVAVEGRIATVRLHNDEVAGTPRYRVVLEDVRALGSGERLVDMIAYVPVGGAPPLPWTRVRARGFLTADGTRPTLAIPAPSGLTTLPSWSGLLGNVIGTARRAVMERLDAALSDEARDFEYRLLLGIQVEDDRLAEERRRAGALHLFAVSGYHFSVIVALLVMAVGTPRAGRGRVWFILAPLLGFYALLVGADPPVLRAFFGAFVVIVSHRRAVASCAGWTVTTTTAGLLAFDPDLARSLGFRLSVFALAGILWLARPLLHPPPGDDPLAAFVRRKTAHRGGRFLLSCVTHSMAVMLTTAPTVIANFGGFAPIALLSDILLVPLVSAALVAGILVLFLPGLGPVVDGLAAASNDVIGCLARVPFGYREVDALPTWLLAGHAGAIIACAILLPILGSRGKRLAFAACVALFAILAAWRAAPPEGQFVLARTDGRETAGLLSGRDFTPLDPSTRDVATGHMVRATRRVDQDGDPFGWLLETPDGQRALWLERPPRGGRSLASLRVDDIILGSEARHASARWEAVFDALRPRRVFLNQRAGAVPEDLADGLLHRGIVSVPRTASRVIWPVKPRREP